MANKRTTPGRAGDKPRRPTTASPSRRGLDPSKRGLNPSARGFDPSKPFQVGRRPSSPLLLFVVGILWVGAGLYALAFLHAGWKLVPAIAFVGIGLFFVRGSSATILRRDRRRDRKE